jgi:hypothetical protein
MYLFIVLPDTILHFSNYLHEMSSKGHRVRILSNIFNLGITEFTKNINQNDTFKQFLENEDIKSDIKEMMMKPIFSMIYNEVYIYIWIIAIYNIFFIIMILAMFFILLKLLNKHKLKESILAQLLHN